MRVRRRKRELRRNGIDAVRGTFPSLECAPSNVNVVECEGLVFQKAQASEMSSALIEQRLIALSVSASEHHDTHMGQQADQEGEVGNSLIEARGERTRKLRSSEAALPEEVEVDIGSRRPGERIDDMNAHGQSLGSARAQTNDGSFQTGRGYSGAAMRVVGGVDEP